MHSKVPSSVLQASDPRYYSVGLTIRSSKADEEAATVAKADKTTSSPSADFVLTMSTTFPCEDAISALLSSTDDNRTESICCKVIASSSPRLKTVIEF